MQEKVILLENALINERIKGLFSPKRLEKGDIPKGHHLYELRLDDGMTDIVSLEGKVRLNFAGSFISPSELTLPSFGFLQINEIEFPQTLRLKYCDGLKDGEQREYFENGVIRSIENWDKGIKNGTFLKFSEDGVLKSTVNYINGQKQSEDRFARKQGPKF